VGVRSQVDWPEDTMTEYRHPVMPPERLYHRVLAGEHRRFGGGVPAIALLLTGMLVFRIRLSLLAAWTSSGVRRCSSAPLEWWL
jgi:hypothetical protein